MNKWIEDNRTVILIAVGLLLAGSIAAFAIRWQQPEPITILPPETPQPSPTPGPTRAYISGAVLNPGVYEMPSGSIVQDLLQAAGGPSADADLARVNLATSLQEGMQIHVPLIGEASPAEVEGAGEASEPTWPININTASQAELEALPGIGPALAQAIIDYRENVGAFTSIEAIQNVSGIGPSKFEAMRELITVGP